MFAFTIYIYFFKVLNFWKNTSLLSEFIMVPCTWWQKNDDQSSSFHCTIVQFLIYLPAGYNYYGTERMYSGVDGREFEADIFFGVVYYQRLRHMVADKYQVINSPPTHPPTHPSYTWFLSHFVSKRFQPVYDDKLLCVSSDWL